MDMEAEPAAPEERDAWVAAQAMAGTRSKKLLTLEGVLARMARLAGKAASARDELAVKKVTAERLILQTLLNAHLQRQELTELRQLERRLAALEDASDALTHDMAQAQGAKES